MQGIRANIFRAAGWTAMVLAMACGSSALGENIRLSTGEVLSVTIIEANDQTIRFVHPVLGELTLPRGVVEILPAAPPA